MHSMAGRNLRHRPGSQHGAAGRAVTLNASVLLLLFQLCKCRMTLEPFRKVLVLQWILVKCWLTHSLPLLCACLGRFSPGSPADTVRLVASHLERQGDEYVIKTFIPSLVLMTDSGQSLTTVCCFCLVDASRWCYKSELAHNQHCLAEFIGIQQDVAVII